MAKRLFCCLHGKNSNLNAVARLAQSDPLHILKAAAQVDVLQQSIESKAKYTCKFGMGGREMPFSLELGSPLAGSEYVLGEFKHLLCHPPNHLVSHVPVNTICVAIF